MCKRPLFIQPKTKRYWRDSCQYVRTLVPCGQCVECRQSKQNEWIFRIFYELKSTIESNGFAIFDTLTFADPFLPHLSDHLDIFKQDRFKHLDFPCFNRHIITNFFKRLRIYLKRKLNFDPANKLKYIIVSEYGTDERFTHRPHHHLLIFCRSNFISPADLSHAIKLCWPYGLTDGIDDHPEKFYDKVFTLASNSSHESLEHVSEYVAKYITKDSSFEISLKWRLNEVRDALFDVDPSGHVNANVVCKEDLDALFKVARRCMCQFHLQSVGFGADFLKYNSLDDVLRTGKISMPHCSSTLPEVSIPLPLYYSRKLFYNLVRDFDDTLKWELSDFGRDYVRAHFPDKVSTVEDRFNSWSNNALPRETKQEFFDRSSKIDSLLAGRSMYDFALYITLYRGRFLPPDIDYFPSAPEMLELALNGSDPGSRAFRSFYVSRRDVLDHFLKNDGLDNFRVRPPLIDPLKFEITQSSFSHFNGFDDLFRLYSDSVSKDFDLYEQTAVFADELKKFINVSLIDSFS